MYRGGGTCWSVPIVAGVVVASMGGTGRESIFWGVFGPGAVFPTSFCGLSFRNFLFFLLSFA